MYKHLFPPRQDRHRAGFENMYSSNPRDERPQALIPGSVVSQMWQTFLLSSHTKQPCRNQQRARLTPAPKPFKGIMFMNMGLCDCWTFLVWGRKWCWLSKLWMMLNGSQQKWRSWSLSHNMEKGWYYNERKRQNSICVPKMLRSMFKHTGTHTRKNMGGNRPKH